MDLSLGKSSCCVRLLVRYLLIMIPSRYLPIIPMSPFGRASHTICTREEFGTMLNVAGNRATLRKVSSLTRDPHFLRRY